MAAAQQIYGRVDPARVHIAQGQAVGEVGIIWILAEDIRADVGCEVAALSLSLCSGLGPQPAEDLRARSPDVLHLQ
ncbi:hypothetical protein [Methanothrix sp.]|uniref:hypothetical protein n=1 Tax=Methanothrix sp. TaxID=90426 RepID=UPI003C73ED63